MKYCLSGRQKFSTLSEADEIKVEIRDYRSLIDYIEHLPDKTIILDINRNIENFSFNWDEIAAYAEKMNGNFYCALNDLKLIPECKSRNIKYYYRYQITSFYELQALKDLGVSYVLIGVPLIFNLKKVKSFDIPIRTRPNLAYEPYILHKDGICGGWIRPEDVEHYEKYVNVFEFESDSLQQEKALFKVYAKDKAWNDNLKFLIKYLDYDFKNNLLYDQDNFAIRRMNCKQICAYGGPCRYCIDQLKFDKIIKAYAKRKEDN